MPRAAAERGREPGDSYPWRNPRGRVLFVGSAYYNTWYLSRALRQRGWIADTLSHGGDGADGFMHGTDYRVIDDPARDPHPRAEDVACFQRLTAEYLARVPRRHGGGTAPSRWQRLRSRAGRWLGGLRRRDPQRLSLPELTTRLLDERRPERLLPLFDEFLTRIQPAPRDVVRPLYEIARRYDVLHFAGVDNLRFGYFLRPPLFGSNPVGWDLDILKRLGKKIVYSHTGCLDGVSQTAFRRWGPYPVCGICRWRDEPTICSDSKNLAWGALRNHLVDYQVLLGGNRVDYNDDPRVHEVPEFYCLDPDVWRPDLPIPDEHRRPAAPGVVRIYHAVGNYDLRTRQGQENIKTTHIIVPAVEQLRDEGYPVELMFCTNVPNKEVRYYQLQSDVVVDMLTYGFFGANIREALMLGKVAVCFLRPEWLECMKAEVPEYVAELPVVSATPDTIRAVLIDLVTHPEKRQELGRRGRAFALKWHSSEAAARRFEQIYSDLVAGFPLLRQSA